MTVRFELLAAVDPVELAPLWAELEQRADPPFFLSWDWIGCWIAEASLRPNVLVGRIDSRLVLLGALVASARRDVLPIATQGLQLHATGNPRQDIITIEYNGFLVDREWSGKVEADAVDFLLAGVVVDHQRRDELHLRNVTASLEQVVAAGGWQYRALQRKPSWRVDLAAIRAAGKQYLDCLSSNTRQQIRRSIRLYKGRGPLVAQRARTVAEAFDFLEGLKELHQRYWTARGEPGAFAYAFFESFQRRLIETCIPQGTLEIIKVAAGPDAIGYIYNFMYRGHVYAYLSGFRYEDDPRLKPGLVSHCACIDLHLAEGAAVYDFMAGEARYKANLGKPGPAMSYLLVQRSTWPVRLESGLHRLKRQLNAVRRTVGRR